MRGLLALDLAGRLGFCSWNPGQRPEIGTYKLPEPCVRLGLGKYLSSYERWLTKKIEKTGIEFVVYEKNILIHAGAKKTNIETARQLMNLTGTTEKVCYDLDVGCASVEVSEWRKHYLGNGGYSTELAKEYAMKKARAAGFDPKFHDAAEALGIMDYAADHFKLKKDWPDTNIFGGRCGVP